MPTQKPNGKKPLKPENLFYKVERYFGRMMRQLFGVTQLWQKGRDIVGNNVALAQQQLELGNFNDAIFRFTIVTWFDPIHVKAWYGLGCAYIAKGKGRKARAALEKALYLKPDYEEAIYMLALLEADSAQHMPAKMPETLARNHFDALAEGYNQQQEEYSYKGHMLLVEALRGQLPAERRDYDILELGIGTGLCGPLLRAFAGQLVGVELSAQMLKVARGLRDAEGNPIYDALVERGIEVFLQEVASLSCDAVVAANVLSYMGDVQPLFPLVAQVLKPGGLFAFTADQAEEEGVHFNAQDGRFGFSRDYLLDCARNAGLREVKLEPGELYPDYQAWVAIFVK